MQGSCGKVLIQWSRWQTYTGNNIPRNSSIKRKVSYNQR